MRKLLSFLPTHFTVCLVIGIVIQFHYKLWIYIHEQTVTLFIIFLLTILLSKYFKKKLLFTILSWVLFVILGMFIVFSNNKTNKDEYYLNHTLKDQLITFRVEKNLKEDLYYYKYLGSVIKVNQHKTIGTVLLNIQKDSLIKEYKIGDVLLFSSDFLPINKPLNPHQFNYKKYLEKLGVHHQVFVRNRLIKKSNTKVFSLHLLADKLRRRIEKSLKKNEILGEELAVIKALVLGQRNDVSKELIEDYTKAGAIHILAVSGLHVGIILMILSFLLKPIERMKYGKGIKTLLIIIFLWSFAIIAGLSASVIRAVTMFTAVAIGMSFKRKTFVLHSLVTSMFILLLLKPMLVFDVGFQLSYLAVFSIVTIQPKLVVVWNPKYKAVNYFWQLFTVSIAAQIGVLPISLYYFHQFPGLFMISNLVIVPFIGLILLIGVLVITLALFNSLPMFLADSYSFIIASMNKFVEWISEKETFLITDISFSTTKLIISYLIFFIGIYLVEKKSYKSTVIFFITIILFQINLFYEKEIMNSKQEFIVFHKNRETVIGTSNFGNLKLYYSLDSLNDVGFIKDYMVGEQLRNVKIEKGIPNVFQFKDDKIFVIDKSGVYKLLKLKNSIVLITQSPKINLERLIITLKPKLIIADASNYKSQVVYWKLVCDKKEIPFYYTGVSGAFKLN